MMYKSIGHLVTGSSRTFDLSELLTGIEGSSNLTQGQGFECSKRVSVSDLLQVFFRELLEPVYFGSIS